MSVCGSRRNRAACAALLLVGLVGGLAVPAVRGQDEGPDPESVAPGLSAIYERASDGGVVARRAEADIRHSWGEARPDARLGLGPFSARWSGFLLIQQPGPHRFEASSDGPVRLSIAGKAVLDTDGGRARSEPLELPPGLVPLEVAYRHRDGSAGVSIAWEGPEFGIEPLPARVLYHEPAGLGPRDDFEEGRRLADRLGCANCHRLLDLPPHHAMGPPLEDAGRAIDPDWLAAWLADPSKVRAGTRMPALGERGLGPDAVADVAAFLAERSKSRPEPTGELKMALNVADTHRGRLLFRSSGCLGCHTRGADGLELELSGPKGLDLSGLGSKREASWVASYLAPTGQGRPSRHRPDMRLDTDSAAHLAAYLVAGTGRTPEPRAHPEGDAARGRRIVESARCAACHAIAGLETPTADLPLGADSNPRGGCLAEGERGGLVPRFALEDRDREALRALVAALPSRPAPTPDETRAEDAMRRLRCLGCHERDGRGGESLGPQLAAYLARDAELGGRKGTLSPPNLTAVGDKLRPEYLAEAVRGEAPEARPWLSVRMPRFAFERGEADAIASALRAHDRLAERDEEAPDAEAMELPAELADREGAAALLGQRGFGCVSCHVVAGRIPPGGEAETLGPDLALAQRRMTRRYFRRWIADPQRVIPGTPMPQFLQPAAGRPGTLDEQLEAIWRVLGDERLGELAAVGTREVRRPSGERAEVVHDMVVLPDGPVESRHLPRGVAIGLGNGQSLLFDSDRLAWVAAWRGGFLSRTKSGRLWEWHPEGEFQWRADERPAPLELLGPDGKVVGPTEGRGRFGTFRGLSFEGQGVALAYTLNLPGGAEVAVRERIAPDVESSWIREVTVLGVPEGVRPVLRGRPGVEPIAMEPDGRGGYRAEVSGAGRSK